MFWARVQLGSQSDPLSGSTGGGESGRAGSGSKVTQNPQTADIHKSATPPIEAFGGRLNLLLSYAGWEPEPWVERLPRLLEPMGIASLRAQSGREASQVLQTSRVHVAVVDLGLPLERFAGPTDPAAHQDGGTRLLELLARLKEPPPVVVIKQAQTRRDESRQLAEALRLGAFAAIDRPRGDNDLDVVLDVLRRVLIRYYQGRWPDTT